MNAYFGHSSGEKLAFGNYDKTNIVKLFTLNMLVVGEISAYLTYQHTCQILVNMDKHRAPHHNFCQDKAFSVVKFIRNDQKPKNRTGFEFPELTHKMLDGALLLLLLSEDPFPNSTQNEVENSECTYVTLSLFDGTLSQGQPSTL